jgi:hypothetical protein
MILRGWKEISARIGKSPRWCHRWRAGGRIPPLPISIINRRVEAIDTHLDGWAKQLVWMNMELRQKRTQ